MYMLIYVCVRMCVCVNEVLCECVHACMCVLVFMCTHWHTALYPLLLMADLYMGRNDASNLDPSHCASEYGGLLLVAICCREK